VKTRLAVSDDVEHGLGLYMTMDEAAHELGLSLGGLTLAMERGELDGCFRRFGRRVRFSRPALRLAALGLADPAALARFCKELGVRDLPSLLAFISGMPEPPTKS
jgi:hypothetical protein